MRMRSIALRSPRLALDPMDAPGIDGQRASGGAAAPQRSRRERHSADERSELAGVVRVRHERREYCGWYRVSGDVLTVHCGIASNSGIVPDVLPSPTPLAERLLRDLIDAEHPGLNPE